MKKVFFDASVLFSAIYSNTGASAKLVSLIGKLIIGITTENCIEELERNIEKIRLSSSYQIQDFINQNKFIVREEINEYEIKPYKGLVDEKDSHVVAGAILTDGDFLVTLDKKHLNNKIVKQRLKKIDILSPKELLFKILS